uniref:ATP synthase complex subunit 8 n=1 Tax=Chrysomeloidea sp. 4 KM-2017 TaxID=2219298 RepID=A0A346RGL4_9CUCU|nr:ATP synthase F0 subunit 8 [Chrysomeloidea sp. 4 KM-2017]
MPQMAPINWLILFIFFSMIILIFSTINYFFFSKVPPSIMKSSKKMKFNWMW